MTDDDFFVELPLFGLVRESPLRPFLLKAANGPPAVPVFTDADLLRTFVRRFATPPDAAPVTLNSLAEARAYLDDTVGVDGWVVVDPTVPLIGSSTGRHMPAAAFLSRLAG